MLEKERNPYWFINKTDMLDKMLESDTQSETLEWNRLAGTYTPAQFLDRINDLYQEVDIWGLLEIVVSDGRPCGEGGEAYLRHVWPLSEEQKRLIQERKLEIAKAAEERDMSAVRLYREVVAKRGQEWTESVS